MNQIEIRGRMNQIEIRGRMFDVACQSSAGVAVIVHPLGWGAIAIVVAS